MNDDFCLHFLEEFGYFFRQIWLALLNYCNRATSKTKIKFCFQIGFKDFLRLFSLEELKLQFESFWFEQLNKNETALKSKSWWKTFLSLEKPQISIIWDFNFVKKKMPVKKVNTSPYYLLSSYIVVTFKIIENFERTILSW
jgi:hypothetical protein